MAIVGAGFTGTVDGLLPGPARPVAAHRGPREGGRRLRRERAQRRLVLGGVPRVARLAGPTLRTRRRRRAVPRDAGRRSTRSAGSSRPRASTARGRKAAPSRWPAPPCSCSGPGLRGRGRGSGASDPRTCSCSTRRRPASGSARRRCSAARYTPHCAVIHPARLVRGLARAVEARGVAIYEHTAVTDISLASRARRTGRASGSGGAGHRGIHLDAAGASPGRRPHLLADARDRAAVGRVLGTAPGSPSGRPGTTCATS